jgi:ADP-ribosylglycohydrolase
MKQSTDTKHAKIMGCIIAGALGDAAGSAFEGLPAGERMLDPSVFHCSDDTYLTLATMESIIEQKQVDMQHIARTYLSYYQSGKLPGIGASTLHALQGLEAGGHWAAVGRKGEYAAGNGAAIRVASLAFMLDPTDYFDRKLIRDMSWLTHHHDEAYAGALAMTLAVYLAWTDQWDQETALSALIIDELPDSRVRDKLVHGRDTTRKPLSEVLQDIGTTGSAFESVPAAILSAEYAREQVFTEIVNEIVCAGGDVDSIASMCGQIYGAKYGIDALPQELITAIPEIDIIVELTGRFSQMMRDTHND